MRKQTSIVTLLATLAAGFGLLTGTVVRGDVYTWNNDGADSSWGTGANWDLDAQPQTQNDQPIINMSGTAKPVLNVTASNDTFGRTWGGNTYNAGWIIDPYIGTSGNTGELDIVDGGGIGLHKWGNREYQIGTGGGTGTVNQSGGLWAPAYATSFIGDGSGSVGTYNLSGGAFATGRAHAIQNLGTNGGTGLFNITGGYFEVTHVTPGPNGTFRVGGSGATDILLNAGDWDQSASGSTLEAQIDSGGVTTIDVIYDSDSDNGGNVTFGSGSKLDLGFLENPREGSWDLMTWDETLTGANELSLTQDSLDNGWSFAFVDTDGSGTDDTLRVTGIPEPSSLVLLALAGLLLVKRRRV